MEHVNDEDELILENLRNPLMKRINIALWGKCNKADKVIL